MTITTEHTLIPVTKRELPNAEAQLFMTIKALIRSGCVIPALSSPSLAQLLRLTHNEVIRLKASLRSKGYLEIEYTRDANNLPAMIVRMPR